jgi:hypothetical protein
MDWFWHALWIGLVLIPVTILWVSCVFDIFARRDMGAASRILWLLGVIVLPFFGSLIYLLSRPRGVGPFGEQATGPRSLDPLSQQLSDLDRLRSKGVIDDREFQLAKEDALARVPNPRGSSAGFSTGAAASREAGTRR